MLKLVFFVPEKYKEIVKESVFKAGAGHIGNYSQCCFETKGVGQFCAGDKANPFIGKEGVLEFVEEYKVEMVLNEEKYSSVLEALFKSHPYETPAYEFYQLYRGNDESEVK